MKRSKQYFCLALASLLLVGLDLSIAQADRIKVLKEKDNGKQFVVIVGETIKVKLASNPTTGYDWHLDNSAQNNFKVLSSGYTPPNTKLVGAGGRSWWQIKVIKPGRAPFKLHYYRIWEGQDKSVDQFKIDLIVLPGKNTLPK